MGSMPPAGSLVTSLFWVQFSYLSYEWALTVLKHRESPILPMPIVNLMQITKEILVTNKALLLFK